LHCGRVAGSPRPRRIAKNQSRETGNENWVFLSRSTAPEMVDGFTLLCANAGFSPRVINEPLSISAVLVVVAAGIGVSVAPACVRSFHQPGVKFISIQPDPPPMDLVAARPAGEPPPAVAPDAFGKTALPTSGCLILC